MNNTNLASKEEKKEWHLSEWYYIVNETAKVFRLEESEKAELYNSITARIIATIPFAAKCIDAERTAIAHIGLYLMEKKGYQKYCTHTPSDDEDVFKRLAFISTFEGGDEKIIRHGMTMLAIIMVEGYKRSEKKDIHNGIYNPIASGKWNYRKLKNNLLEALSESENEDLDNLFVVATDPSGRGW